jgi:hypothetical protein
VNSPQKVNSPAGGEARSQALPTFSGFGEKASVFAKFGSRSGAAIALVVPKEAPERFLRL